MKTPRGYTQYDPATAPMLVDGAVVPPPDKPHAAHFAPGYFAWVAHVAAELKAAEPWTLVRLPGEVHYCVAVRRNWWWRLVTRWHNVWRRWTRRAYQRGFERRAQH